VVPVTLADPRYDEAIADLQQALEAGRARLDPGTIRILEANLDAIDTAIEQSRRALATDPANVYLHSHLAEARQRKLALLRRGVDLANGQS
jgi:tetratricopeptide (TPR) repeat protein